MITSVGSGIGQAIVDSLRLSEMDVRMVGVDMSPWASGLYAVHQACLVPPCSDPAYLPALLEICQREKVDLLYPGNDLELMVLASQRTSFEQIGTRVLIGSPEVVEVVRDKRQSYKFFSQHQLPFVKTLTLEEFLSGPEAFNWPIVIKPVSGSGSVGAEVIFEKSQMEKYKPGNGNYIVQEYLLPSAYSCSRQELTRNFLMPCGALRQEHELSVQFLVSHTGDILGSFMSIHTLKQGMPVHITPYQDPKVEEICAGMVQALINIGLVGPINLQGRITNTGPVFYELNHRFTGITAVRARLGFNECAAIFEDFCLALPFEKVQSKLEINYDLICTRYWTDMVVNRKQFETLKANKFFGRDLQ